MIIDIRPDTLNIDPEKIKEAISPRTRAILPVEVFGSCGDFDVICRIAEKHGLAVVEDCCEALGSSLKGKKAGTFGQMSVFAFYPNKQITTGEGGMILTDDDDLAELCRSYRNQGRGATSGWLGHERLGYNFRLSDINCALGIVQLSRIEHIKAKRRQVASWYQDMLKDMPEVVVPYAPADCDMSWFVFVVRLRDAFSRKQRDAVLTELNARGIQASNYFPPVHLQPFLAEQFGYKNGDLPVTEAISARTIALPFYNNLTKQEVAFVCEQLGQAVGEIAG